METCSTRLPAASPLATVTALIVDDEAHVRTYLRLVLNSLGVTTVLEAADGAKGLELYQQYQPMVMLLDVNMPVMGGTDVMQELAAIDPDAMVIIVTSENELETVKRFLQLGAIGYVLKHLPKDRLTQALAETLTGLVVAEEQSA